MNKILSLQEDIKKHLKQIIIDLGCTNQSLNIILEEPKEKINGDYSTNCAMQLAKDFRKSPKIIAKEIVEKFHKEKYNVERIEIAGPGFINFYMNNHYLTQIIKDVIVLDEAYGKTNYGNQTKVNVEFVSANPTGDLHIGHARGAAIGDTLCRVLEKAGYIVAREYYINDAGNQIHNLALSTICRYEQLLGKESTMPEDGYYGQDIINIAKELVEKYGDKYLNDSNERYQLFREYAKKVELEKIKKDLETFNVTFNVWSSEQALYDEKKVETAITKLDAKGYIYEHEGATWFKSTAFGDDKDRVLRKTDKTLTYLTPDIAYHIDKLERGYDKLIDILGADHHGYIPRLKASIECLSGDSEKLEVLIIQMVRLIKNGEEYKMSKRSGKALTIRDLIDEVGVDAIRYFFAMRSGDSQMDFDIDLATKKSNENPVYYAQYAHARIGSILKQADEKKINYVLLDDYNHINSEKAFDVLKKLAEFPKSIIDSAIKRAPHRMTLYINELAQAFHSFYNAEKVINEENIEKTKQLLALIKATQITLRNALSIIGVSAPDKM
ncbi:arginine--tRNA ligase [Mycoplasmatota bacterium]|nr:arginine--tRNA ligase [Mycoplasmatota bacterium]